MKTIQIKQCIPGTLIREGAGVKLHRYIGSSQLSEFDPFLLLDVFDSHDPMDYIAGFPSHPHRGFETITYLLDGQIKHADNHGNQGIIKAGDVQWMTAGRGIIHSEMPSSETNRLRGIQLWLNLPAQKKLIEPRYQEYGSSSLPVINLGHHDQIKIIAGKVGEKSAPIQGIATDPMFLDVSLSQDKDYSFTMNNSHHSILYVFAGALRVGQLSTDGFVSAGEMAVLTRGERLTLCGKEGNNHALLISARIIDEPVARLGPFVMNTRDEVLQALDDFRNNRF